MVQLVFLFFSAILPLFMLWPGSCCRFVILEELTWTRTSGSSCDSFFLEELTCSRTSGSSAALSFWKSSPGPGPLCPTFWLLLVFPCAAYWIAAVKLAAKLPLGPLMFFYLINFPGTLTGSRYGHRYLLDQIFTPMLWLPTAYNNAEIYIVLSKTTYQHVFFLIFHCFPM